MTMESPVTFTGTASMRSTSVILLVRSFSTSLPQGADCCEMGASPYAGHTRWLHECARRAMGEILSSGEVGQVALG